MKLIIGLGNIGQEYAKTRHNFGFMALDTLVSADSWKNSKKAQADYVKTKISNQLVELIKPTTFMNNSGLAVSYAVNKHKLSAENCIIIYDDIDLPLGTIRTGVFTSSGGHNGIKSIIGALSGQTTFYRIRLGIKNNLSEKIMTEKFVLQPFTKFEQKTVDQVIARTTQILTDLLAKETLPKNQQTISVL